MRASIHCRTFCVPYILSVFQNILISDFLHLLLHFSFSSHYFTSSSVKNNGKYLKSLTLSILDQPHYILFLYLLVFCYCHVFGFLYLNCKFSFLCRLITVSYRFLPHFCNLPPITVPSVQAVISHFLLCAVSAVLLCLTHNAVLTLY